MGLRKASSALLLSSLLACQTVHAEAEFTAGGEKYHCKLDAVQWGNAQLELHIPIQSQAPAVPPVNLSIFSSPAPAPAPAGGIDLICLNAHGAPPTQSFWQIVLSIVTSIGGLFAAGVI